MKQSTLELTRFYTLTVDELQGLQATTDELLRNHKLCSGKDRTGHLQTYIKRASVSTVYLSNKLEQTFLFEAPLHETTRLLEDMYDAGLDALQGPIIMTLNH